MMKATHLVCLAVLEEVFQNILGFRYAREYFCKFDKLFCPHICSWLNTVLLMQVEKIDIIIAVMGHALATDGGFCTGSVELLITNVSVVQDTSFLHHCLLILHVLQLLQEEHPSLLTKLKENVVLLWKGLSDIPDLSVTSNPLASIEFLKLKNSTGSFEKDLKLLEDIVNHVLKEDSVLLISSKRSTLDKCTLPAGIRMFVSASHSDSDLLKGF